MANRGRSLKEAKAEKAAKKRRARRRKRAFFMIMEFLILFVLLAVGYVMVKYGKIQLNAFGDGDIVFNDGVKQEGYTTIALFGGDSREGQLEAGTHADTIIVASINEATKEWSKWRNVRKPRVTTYTCLARWRPISGQSGRKIGSHVSLKTRVHPNGDL